MDIGFLDGKSAEVPSPQQFPLCDGMKNIPDVPAVYFLYADRGGPVTYVGQSARLRRRLQGHRKRWKFRAYRYFEEPDEEKRLLWECLYIVILRPERNFAVLLRLSNGSLRAIKGPIGPRFRKPTSATRR